MNPRLGILWGALACVVTLTPVSAQPSSSGSAAPPNAAPAPFDPRLYSAAGNRFGQAGLDLKAWYDARHARDPSQPTFEKASEAAVQARLDDFVQVVRQRLDRLASSGALDTISSPSLQAIGAGRFASLSKHDQEQAIGDMLDFTFSSARTGNDSTADTLAWAASVMDRMADAIPANDPARARIRAEIDSAATLFEYEFAQSGRDIDLAQSQIEPHRAEIIAATRQEMSRGSNAPVPDLELGTSKNGIRIYSDGAIMTAVWAGEGYQHASSAPEYDILVPTHGVGTISDAMRRRAEAFVRENFPARAREWLPQIDNYIERINSAARRRQLEGGGGSAGGSSGEGGGGGRGLTVLDNFLDAGGTLEVADLIQIYGGNDPFDPMRTAGSHAGQSLSAVGTSGSAVWWTPSSAGSSPSSVGWSLSAAGTSLSSVGTSLDYGWGGGISLAGSPTMSFAGGPIDLTPSSATTVALHSAWNGLYQDVSYRSGAYGLIRDPFGTLGEFSRGAQLAGFTNALTRDEILRVLRTSGSAGLNRLLAQPFNVLMTWGPNAYDLDLHMTGPSGTNDGTRFHIYFSQRGSQTSFPFAELIKDCICTSGSEVILTTRLLQGGVYRISAFNFGNQSPTSTQLTTNADLQLLIVRGGVAVSVGNGTTIQGGTVLFRGSPTPGQAGNTWVGVEIDPRTGQIRFVNQTNNSGGGDTPAAVAARAASIQGLSGVLPLRGGRVGEQ